jgi:hypothetical protein
MRCDSQHRCYGGVRSLSMTYVQAVTNCVRIYTGGGKIRNAQSAAYFLQWIEKLRAMIEDLHHWRTAAEK